MRTVTYMPLQWWVTCHATCKRSFGYSHLSILLARYRNEVLQVLLRAIRREGATWVTDTLAEFSTLCKDMTLEACCRVHIPQHSQPWSVQRGIIRLLPDQPSHPTPHSMSTQALTVEAPPDSPVAKLVFQAMFNKAWYAKDSTRVVSDRRTQGSTHFIFIKHSYSLYSARWSSCFRTEACSYRIKVSGSCIPS